MPVRTLSQTRADLGEIADRVQRLVEALESAKTALPFSFPQDPQFGDTADLEAACETAAETLRTVAAGLRRGSKRRESGERSPVTIPAWIEGDSIRETTLICLDRQQDRDALRNVGRMLYHFAVEATRQPGLESATREEMRAVAAELRYVQGYLTQVVFQSAENSSLEASDERLARFGGQLAGRVSRLAESIDRRLQ
jgi:hypothetical protein